MTKTSNIRKNVIHFHQEKSTTPTVLGVWFEGLLLIVQRTVSGRKMEYFSDPIKTNRLFYNFTQFFILFYPLSVSFIRSLHYMDHSSFAGYFVGHIGYRVHVKS